MKMYTYDNLMDFNFQNIGETYTGENGLIVVSEYCGLGKTVSVIGILNDDITKYENLNDFSYEQLYHKTTLDDSQILTDKYIFHKEVVGYEKGLITVDDLINVYYSDFAIKQMYEMTLECMERFEELDKKYEFID